MAALWRCARTRAEKKSAAAVRPAGESRGGGRQRGAPPPTLRFGRLRRKKKFAPRAQRDFIWAASRPPPRRHIGPFEWTPQNQPPPRHFPLVARGHARRGQKNSGGAASPATFFWRRARRQPSAPRTIFFCAPVRAPRRATEVTGRGCADRHANFFSPRGRAPRAGFERRRPGCHCGGDVRSVTLTRGADRFFSARARPKGSVGVEGGFAVPTQRDQYGGAAAASRPPI